MARAIDGDELLGIERLLDTGIVRQSKTASWLLDQVLHDIQAMPNYAGSTMLDGLYLWLTGLGYEMSGDERALQDGTHELFHVSEVESDVD